MSEWEKASFFRLYNISQVRKSCPKINSPCLGAYSFDILYNAKRDIYIANSPRPLQHSHLNYYIFFLIFFFFASSCFIANGLSHAKTKQVQTQKRWELADVKTSTFKKNKFYNFIGIHSIHTESACAVRHNVSLASLVFVFYLSSHLYKSASS